MDVDVARVAKREPGMNPVEVLTSESQERMLAIVEPANLDAVLALARRWEIRATVVGRVTDTARFRVFDGLFDAVGVPGENPAPPIGDAQPAVELRRAADRRRSGRESRRRPALPPPGRAPGRAGRAASRRSRRRSCATSSPPAPTSRASCSRCSPRRRSPTRRGSRASTTTSCSSTRWSGPGGDAAVLRVKGTTKALALSTDGKARFCRLDPRTGGRLVVLEAARNVACTGARPIALVNCLNFGNPEHPEVMWQFSRSRRGHERGVRSARHPGRSAATSASTTRRATTTSTRRRSSVCSG